jgi:pimeloyl-ACP methyl ester carboxylesterase
MSSEAFASRVVWTADAVSAAGVPEEGRAGVPSGGGARLPAGVGAESAEAAEAAGRHTAPASQWADLGVLVHYVDHGGPADGPLLVLVHGLGGSLVNWAALAPLLTDTCRVLALDLIGFGHTQAGTHSTSVTANQLMLHRFLTEVVGGPAILVGNSMGGMITLLQAARHPETVTALALIDPALPTRLGSPPEALIAASFGMYAVPRLGRAMLKARRRMRTPEQIAMDVLHICCVDPGRLPAAVLEQHMEVARARRGYPDLDEHFLVAARSLMGMLTRRSSYLATIKAIQAPVLLLHGEKDRLVTIGASRAVAAANPSWRFEVAPDVGHVPQLEVPSWTADHILDWLATEVRRNGRAGAISEDSEISEDTEQR